MPRTSHWMPSGSKCGGWNALPDWRELKEKLGQPVSEIETDRVVTAIAYLLEEPPQVQMYVDGRPEFVERELDGENSGAQAIEAAKRVRNNLFHGGKHTPPQMSQLRFQRHLHTSWSQ